MPVFQYGGYRSPYVQSISALLEAPGQIEAQRAQTVGNAQARAAQQSGQAFGNAAAQAGASIGGAIAQEADPKTKLERLQLGEAQRTLQSRTALGKIVSATPHVDENGISLYDIPAISKQLETAGFGDHVGDVATQLKGVNDAFRAEQAAKLALVQRGAQALLQADADPGLTLHFIDTLDKNGSAPKEQLDYFRKLIHDDPTKTAAILKQFAGPAKIGTAAPGSTLYDEASGATMGTVPEKPGEGDYTINGQRFRKDGTPIGAAVPPQTSKSLQRDNVLVDGKPTTVLVDPDPTATQKVFDLEGKPIADAAKRVKPIPTAAQVNISAGNLTDAAKRQAAQKYLDSGVLPPGYGGAGAQIRTEVMNLAAEMDPHAALARNAATFKADSANLTNLQRTEGTLSAFENTAGKNLDQFLALADKIPDTGIPWLNTPIRNLDANTVGSANMAAINAARDVALREIARVTNDPKLSGALTDSARAEVLGLSPRNATLPQIKAVAKVLKQDMANVHQGINEQIASVKAGIGSNPAAPPPVVPPPVVPPPAAPPKIVRYDMSGKVIP